MAKLSRRLTIGAAIIAAGLVLWQIVNPLDSNRNTGFWCFRTPVNALVCGGGLIALDRVIWTVMTRNAPRRRPSRTINPPSSSARHNRRPKPLKEAA